MDLKHLRYFVAMAEAGSLMKAAERMHVAQPALSVHLSNLEVELGVILVHRSNRGIELTEQGQLLYERAVKLLRYHSDAILSLKRSKTKPTGSISFGMPSTMPGLMTPYIYEAFKTELPDVSVYVLDASTAALYEWLQTGKLDFAVLFNLPDDVGMSLQPLFAEDYYLVGQFPEGEGSSEVLFDSIFDYPLAAPCRATSWRKILEEAADRRGKCLSVTFESDSYAALRSLALTGACFTILPRSSILQDVADGNLQARRIVSPDLRGHLSLASDSNRETTPAQRAGGLLLTKTIRRAAEELGLNAEGSAARKVCPTSLFVRPRRLPLTSSMMLSA
ncbi:LysR family transcriptional regulator [Sphingomonas sp. ID0503]|uniref:LysR family transcriptional regulator n=1 Tax=Sphingomonas sp. ID0503 TaxID=3399691 RepID=UPI003AFAE6F2